MGQQQLLLVILVTILVGIATLVAFNVFGTATEEANRDAVRQDILGAAAQAQAIWTRPAMMDGANQDFTTLDATALLPRLNIPGQLVGTTVVNENGTYSIGGLAEAQFQITAVPTSGTDDIVATIARVDGQWVIGWPTLPGAEVVPE